MANVFSQEAVQPQWRTAMSAAFTVGVAVGWASAAALGGYVIAGLGYTSLFGLGAISAIASVVLVFAYQRFVATRPENVPVQP